MTLLECTSSYPAIAGHCICHHSESNPHFLATTFMTVIAGHSGHHDAEISACKTGECTLTVRGCCSQSPCDPLLALPGQHHPYSTEAQSPHAAMHP